MTQDTSITAIQGLVEKIIADQPDIFLVSVRIKPTNNIKVYLDADNGLNIDKCVKINRAMYRTIEEEGWYPDGNFSLEVSSPGVDEPLKLLRQYLKNVGRNLEITYQDGTRREGKLIGADEQQLYLEFTEGKNKKAVTHTVEIPYDQVKQAIVLISF